VANADSSPERRPPLGAFTLLALGINGIVGVGIFFAPREVAAAVPGFGGLFVYAAVAALLVPAGLVYARLGRAFPHDGGPYLYARAAFGKAAAFGVGWTTYVSALFSTAAVVTGLVDAVAPTLGIDGTAGRLTAALTLVTVLTAALSLGLRLSAATWSAVTVLKAVPLLALPVAFCFAHIETSPAPLAPVQPAGVLAASLPVLFALQGFEVVPLPAAQVARPSTTIPLATIGSLGFAALLYVMLHAACVQALPDLPAHELPLADAAGVYGGAGFRRLMVITTSISALGIAVGMLAMTPRYLMPLGEEDALGFGLSEQSARAVPLRATLVTYALLLAILTASALWGSIKNLLALSSLSVTVQYAVTSGSLFVLARKRSASLSPADAWPAPFALASSLFMAAGASAIEVPIIGAMLALGLVLRGWRRRLRAPVASP
jgi:basic amino acid/polyamine antiporter, APA family